VSGEGAIDLSQKATPPWVSEGTTALAHFSGRVSQSESYSFCLLLIVRKPVLWRCNSSPLGQGALIANSLAIGLDNAIARVFFL